MSTISFLYAILNGRICLHISQSTLLNLSMTWPLWTFLVDWVSSQDRRHLRWIMPCVPMQRQGEMSGFGSSPCSCASLSSASVPQQILQQASSSDFIVRFVCRTWPASSSEAYRFGLLVSFLGERLCDDLPPWLSATSSFSISFSTAIPPPRSFSFLSTHLLWWML